LNSTQGKKTKQAADVFLLVDRGARKEGILLLGRRKKKDRFHGRHGMYHCGGNDRTRGKSERGFEITLSRKNTKKEKRGSETRPNFSYPNVAEKKEKGKGEKKGGERGPVFPYDNYVWARGGSHRNKGARPSMLN